MADKKFEPHMMYGKNGQQEYANTLDDHERLSKTEVKDHSPAPFKLREVNSPMKCWKTHRKVGMKKSPSGRKKNGKVVMVNDCKKR